MRIQRATDEMRDGSITPIEFLQKIANIDNKIMTLSSEDDLTNDQINDSIHSNNDNRSESESESEGDEDPSNCIEVLLMPSAHIYAVAKCAGKNKRIKEIQRVAQFAQLEIVI